MGVCISGVQKSCLCASGVQHWDPSVLHVIVESVDGQPHVIIVHGRGGSGGRSLKQHPLPLYKLRKNTKINTVPTPTVAWTRP